MTEPHELLQHVREPHDERRARRNWEAIAARRLDRRGSRPHSARTPVLAALGIAAAVLAGWGLARHAPPAALRGAAGDALPELVTGAIVLDDASRIEVDGRLELLDNAGDRVRWWLREGRARFDVTPGGPRRWVIEAGHVTIEVLGTSFVVTRGIAEVRVQVERGSVLVRGPRVPDGLRRLAAGGAIAVPEGEIVATGPSRTEAQSGSEAAVPSVAERARDPEPMAAGSPAGRAPRDRTAPEPRVGTEPSAPAIDEVPLEVASAERRSSGVRMREADALRTAGRVDEAIVVLDAIVGDESMGRDRALAAFTIGRLELAQRRSPRAAADAFARAIELGLPATLLDDARARRVEALARVPDVAAACAAAEEYRTRHPGGRWRVEVEAWCGRP